MKQCSKCGEQKPLDEFHRDSKRRDGRHGHCKTCVLARVTKYRADNPEKIKESQRRSRAKNPEVYRNKQLLWTFGITLEEYQRIEAEQEGVCAVCGEAETEMHPQSGKPRNLAVDHDHNTGAIRGLLCNACNRGIGLMNDNPETLRAAITYLERQKPPAETGG